VHPLVASRQRATALAIAPARQQGRHVGLGSVPRISGSDCRGPQSSSDGCATVSTCKKLHCMSIAVLSRLRTEAHWRWTFLRTFARPSSGVEFTLAGMQSQWMSAFTSELSRQPEGPLPGLTSNFHVDREMKELWAGLRFDPFRGSTCSVVKPGPHPGAYVGWPTRALSAREKQLPVIKGSVLTLRGLRCRGKFLESPIGVKDCEIVHDLRCPQPSISFGQLIAGLHKYYSQWHFDPNSARDTASHSVQWAFVHANAFRTTGRLSCDPLLSPNDDGTWSASCY